MRFVSKSSNLMVVLRPGIPGSSITGAQPINGIYIKFSGGIVDVKDEKFIEMMKNHPGFNRDFIVVEDTAEDPYDYQRRDIEPAHIVQETKYGHLENVKGTPKNNKLSPELKQLLEAEATKMAKAMLPDMVKAVLQEMASKQAEKTEEASKNSGTDDILEERVEKTEKVTKNKSKSSKEESPAA